MIRNNTDLPYMNNVLMAHRATNILYRKGPAQKAQLVFPSAFPPSPQSAVVQTLPPTRPSSKQPRAYIQHMDGERAQTARRVRLSYEGDGLRDWSLRILSPFVSVTKSISSIMATMLHAIGFNESVSKSTRYGNDDGKDVAPAALRIYRGFCAADFEDSEDEKDALCDDSDIESLDLKAATCWSNCIWETPQENRLTTIQLRILENVLRDIVAQALAARRNDRLDSSIFSEEAPEEEDMLLEMMLELMELGHSMMDAKAFQGEEGGDIQMMVRNNFHTLMGKATRPFRPSGIKIVKAELSSCLEAFRQLRLRLLWENQGMSMAEILKERNLDVRPR